ncbi:MAG: flavin monoamine oxidase family protein [Bosea sp. (in: a-proteobacteria)]
MLTRRQITAASLALGAASLAGARRAAFAADVDVIVIGAGAAGIFAARDLKAAGKNVLVLEARGRVGGRLHTERSLGAPYDAGAGFIHFSDRNPWTQVARDIGIEARPGSWSGWNRGFIEGKPLTGEEIGRRSAAFSEVSTLIDDRDVDDADVSFAQALANASPEARAIALQRSQMAMGEQPERLSVAEWQVLWSGGNLVVPEGYGTLAERAAAGLNIRLNTPVTAIRWDGPGVVVETAGGVISARAVVVTVPVGVLKRDAIRFSPRLPNATLKGLDALSMGALTKVGLSIDPALLPNEAEGGFSDMSAGSAMTVQIKPFGQPVILCHLGGDPARALCEAGEAAAIDHVSNRLVAVLGSEARKAIKAGKLAGWWVDPFSRGGFSVAKPGRFADRELLSRPVGGRIWFAGEANAGQASVTAGGAAIAGQAAAKEISARLKA